MSLNYDFTKVKDGEKICKRYTGEKDDNGDELWELTPTTKSLIFSTMTVGLGRITEKNYKEFFKRVSEVEEVLGSYRSMRVDGKTESVYFTLEEVKAHIGLSTNVCNESKTKFKNTIYRMIEGSARRRVRLSQKDCSKK